VSSLATGLTSSPVATVKSLLLDPECTPFVSRALLLAEIVLCVVIVNIVPYTEIDWKAYMDEVEGVVNGTYDYTLLKGDTGPLVYPAGFVYLFGAFYYATDYGANILRAQYMFCALYVINLAMVHSLYIRSQAKIAPYVLIMMSVCSYRLHSIFVLRLFNDPIALMFLYAAAHLFLSNKWLTGSLLFTLGVSIKMNVLLFAPGLGILMWITLGFWQTIPCLLVCAGTQVFLGMPFMLDNFAGYMNGAFEFSRQFKYVWTVNWRNIPEELFLNRSFHAALLALHLGTIAFFVFRQWTVPEGGLLKVLTKATPVDSTAQQPANRRFVHILFVSNFIGMVFSRSLHYQFYSWYFYTIPYLLWHTTLPVVVRMALLLALEWSWNVFPATPTSSSVLHVCHAIILVALMFAGYVGEAGAAGADGAGKQKMR